MTDWGLSETVSELTRCIAHVGVLTSISDLDSARLSRARNTLEGVVDAPSTGGLVCKLDSYWGAELGKLLFLEATRAAGARASSRRALRRVRSLSGHLLPNRACPTAAVSPVPPPAHLDLSFFFLGFSCAGRRVSIRRCTRASSPLLTLVMALHTLIP